MSTTMTPDWSTIGPLAGPTAVVDLDVLDANATRLLALADGTPVRVASKSVRVRQLLQRVLERPGFSGVLAYAAAEAEWLAASGIDDVLVAYPSVDVEAMRRISADARLAAAVTFMADLPEHVALLASAVGAHPLRVALDVDCALRVGRISLGARRSRVRTPAQAAGMAALVRGTPGLTLVGLMFYEAQVAGVPDSRVMDAVKAASLRQLRTLRGAVRDAVEAGGALEFVNGGGTGSLGLTRLDPAITELAAGSGLFTPTTFDGFRSLGTRPAAWFVSPVTRKPADDIVVVAAGGYPASGVMDASRRPTPVHPAGLHYLPREGAGEVQTPLRGPAARSLRVGDPVWFRHAKAGEMCERFDEVLLVRGGQVVGRTPTYRGEGHNHG